MYIVIMKDRKDTIWEGETEIKNRTQKCWERERDVGRKERHKGIIELDGPSGRMNEWDRKSWTFRKRKSESMEMEIRKHRDTKS